MKQLINYINEAFKVTKNSKVRDYKYFPESTLDLVDIIKKKIKDKDYDLNDISVGNITDMSNLFKMARVKDLNTNDEFFEQMDVSHWDVSNVKNMSGMFSSCWKFNSDISKWDVSKCKDFSEMFSGCERFNQDISKWDVHSAKNMNAMFARCTEFNQDLSDWDVSNCEEFQYMFMYCHNIDFDINKWDMRKAKTVSSILYQCKNFNTKPDKMKLPKYCGKQYMLTGTPWQDDADKWYK